MKRPALGSGRRLAAPRRRRRSGGAAVAQGAPVYGGTLTIAYTSTSPHIDIQATNQGSLSESAHYIYETLFDRRGRRDRAAAGDRLHRRRRRPRPHLHLQPGVTFHDGTPFDAAAVKYNFERKIELKLPTTT
jgi:peptide/nickel transport system substrate-binding protein